jgi:RNA polymerase sigma factor (sigma-70 family)
MPTIPSTATSLTPASRRAGCATAGALRADEPSERYPHRENANHPGEAAEVSHLGLRRCLVGVMGLQARHNERLERLDDGCGVAAFESFFRNHYLAVVRLAQSVVGDSQRAQDVAQDVFLAAYRRFPGDYEQAAGWVRVATVHTALNVLRGERRRDTRELRVQVVTSLPSAEDTVIERERRADVRRVLRRLPRRSAAVLVMRHGGMSYVEIADALGVRIGHVGTLLRRAESALRKEMDRETHL